MGRGRSWGGPGLPLKRFWFDFTTRGR